MTYDQSGDDPAVTPCDVLIVEDDVLQAEEMAGFLARAGLDVRSAHDGTVALRYAPQLRPRVAVLDYNLPDTNGVQLAAQLRAVLPDTAIILMSGRIEGLSEQTLREIGITVFVNKPVPLSALRQAVLRLVQSGPPKRQAEAQKSWFSTGVGGQRK